MIKPNEQTIIDIRGKDQTKMKDLEFYFSGQQTCVPGHNRRGIRDYYLIHYITKGKGVYKANNQQHDLKSGQGFLICPNKMTVYEADKNNPWSYIWVAFHGKQVASILQSVGLSIDTPIFDYHKDEAVEQCLLKMVENHGQKSQEYYLLSQLYNFFYLLASVHKETSKFTDYERGQKERLELALDFICKNYSYRTGVNEIAEYMGLSRKYLYAIFNQHLGISPQQYLLQYRMEKACNYLEKGELTVKEVAQSVGYDDPYLFSRMFKRQKGIAPSYWVTRNI